MGDSKQSKTSTYFYAVGRRKTAVAKVYLTPSDSKGTVIVNKKDIGEYFPAGLEENVLLPLKKTMTFGKYNVEIFIVGGGFSSQSDAARHGVARALEKSDSGLRLLLKQSGYLSRDSRVKERKKYGHKKARKSPQWSKR